MESQKLWTKISYTKMRGQKERLRLYKKNLQACQQEKFANKRQRITTRCGADANPEPNTRTRITVTVHIAIGMGGIVSYRREHSATVDSKRITTRCGADANPEPNTRPRVTVTVHIASGTTKRKSVCASGLRV